MYYICTFQIAVDFSYVVFTYGRERGKGLLLGNAGAERYRENTNRRRSGYG